MDHFNIYFVRKLIRSTFFIWNGQRIYLNIGYLFKNTQNYKYLFQIDFPFFDCDSMNLFIILKMVYLP